jgi:peptide/nickel transport system permease protein
VTRFIAKRAIDSVIALLGLLILVFVLTRMTGDPTDLYLPDNASIETREAFAESHGYNDPIYQQFFRYFYDLLHLEFGTSLRQQRSAVAAVLEAFPTTLMIAGLGMSVAIVLALILGSLAASRPNHLFDRLATIFSLFGASAPDFWIAIVGILVFAVGLGWLPTSGTGGFEYWIMPIAVVALRPFGLLTQVVRATMISALASPYVKTARAKGVRDRAIVFRHALRSSLLPVITVAGDLTVGMINGAIIVEIVFGIRGVGKVLIDSILQRDFAVVQSTVMVIALTIFLLNIAIDVLYAVVDPRIRHR